MTIRAVLFDYGLVLTGPPDARAWERMKQMLKADESAFHAAYWRPRHDYDRGALNAQAYWRAVATELGHGFDAQLLLALTEADVDLWTQPNPEMIAWAARLQRRGLRTGILSNIGDAMETGVRARCPWLEQFGHLTFSHALGMAKPEQAIYRHAAQGLGVPPEEILFVDDREENIAAARAIGMHAIQYNDHGSFLKAMNAAGLGNFLMPDAPQE